MLPFEKKKIASLLYFPDSRVLLLTDGVCASAVRWWPGPGGTGVMNNTMNK
jgi:hypothetical protein